MSYLTPEDHAKIKKLKEVDNLTIRDIAKRMRRSEATVANVLKGIANPRYRKPPAPRIPLRDEQDGYVDFASLPNDVMFRHVRECNFIG